MKRIIFETNPRMWLIGFDRFRGPFGERHIIAYFLCWSWEFVPGRL